MPQINARLFFMIEDAAKSFGLTDVEVTAFDPGPAKTCKFSVWARDLEGRQVCLSAPRMRNQVWGEVSAALSVIGVRQHRSTVA